MSTPADSTVPTAQAATLTKREHFAALIMTGLVTLQCRGFNQELRGVFHGTARQAVEAADALINALNRD